MIPDGWERKSLGEVADISSGSTPLRQKDEYWNEGTIPWVTTGEIDYQIIGSTKEKITELACKECSLKIYAQGTILMAMYGQGLTRGRIALLGINAATNQACCAISVNSSASTKFIYFQLEHLYDEIRKLGHGGNQQNLNGQIIKQIPIIIPPLSEQCKIAEILGAWDEAIDLLEKLVASNRSLKQGLMQQLLTGKKRFKEFEGSEWETVLLDTVVSEFIVPMRDKPKNFEGNIPWCRIEDLDGIYISDSKSKQYVDGETISAMNLKVYPINTLIVSCSANLGVCAIVKKPLITNQTFIGLVPISSKVDSLFLYYLMILSARKLNRLASGTTISYLSREKFEKFDILLPPLPEQEKIAAVLSAADEEISTLEKQLAAYKRQKIGLMQQLLTGRIRI
jgi:type I restriction enzyme, S subunit